MDSRQDKFINIILKKSSVIKELDRSFLFRYDDVRTFFFPKRLIFKKVISDQDDRMFNKVDINTEDYQYVTLSIPKNSNFTTIEISEPVKETNDRGELVNKRDENNRNIYQKEEISIMDLKDHFREESNDISVKLKKLKVWNKNKASIRTF